MSDAEDAGDGAASVGGAGRVGGSAGGTDADLPRAQKHRFVSLPQLPAF